MSGNAQKAGMNSDDVQRIDTLEQVLDFHFKNRVQALSALTHSSFLHENSVPSGVTDNERLEFLGDAVVDLAVGLRLMQRFPMENEGALSRMRSEIVDERGLARVARRIGLGEILKLGWGEKKSGGADKPSVISDAMEAVLAAVFLEGGLDPVLKIIDRYFGDLFDEAASGAGDIDVKAMLQTWTQANLKVLPTYEVVFEDGPSHAREFIVQAIVEGVVRGSGRAHSKKAAARNAPQYPNNQNFFRCAVPC